jgi:hypothetical protein
MGFSDDDIRASHTIRIFGTNANGDLLRDIWLDVERIDIYRVTTQIDGHFQGLYRRLYWLDDPASNDYNADGNPARSEGLKKFCSPDQADQENPDEWVPVRTIIEMSFNERTDSNQRSGRRGNRTSADNQVRAVASRRCYHRDTTIDDAAAAAADQGRTAYVVASNQYDFVDGSEDKDNYIEVQYVSSTLEQSSAKEDEGKTQMVQTNWKNIHYLNFTDEAQGPANPIHGFDPPWALDPFQAVVNVNFGGGGLFAASMVFDSSGFNLKSSFLRAKMPSKTSEQSWTITGSFSPFNHVVETRCGTYGNPGNNPTTGAKGKPTFVFAGLDQDFSAADGSFINRSFIETSIDGGKTWTISYSSLNSLASTAAYNDDKQLFYVQIADNLDAPSFHWVTLSSPDGLAWSEAARFSAGSANPNYASPLLLDASSPLYKDATGQNCPDGVYGHDKKKRIVIAPYPKLTAYAAVKLYNGEQIEILKYDEHDTLLSRRVQSIGGMTRVFSVAFAGGIWTATGAAGDDTNSFGKIAWSIDDGTNWTISYAGSSSSTVSLITLGAPKPDFPSGTFT